MIAVSLSTFSHETFTNMFFENIEGQVLTKLHDKILVTLVNISVKEKQKISVLVPLSDEELIAFTTLFNLRNPSTHYSLSFIINSRKRDDLFKRIPIIEGLMTDFIDQVKLDNFEIKTMFSFPKFQELLHDVVENVNELFLMDPLGYSIPKNSSFMKLISDLGDSIHMFFNAVVNNKKTVLLANFQNDGFLLQYPWDNLIARKNLKIKFWPSTVPNDESFDILIIDKTQKQDCNPDWCTIDLESGTVENGESDTSLQTYFTYLKDLNKGLGNTMKVSKLNPHVVSNDKVILSNFVLSDENYQENEIYLVQSKGLEKTNEIAM